VRVRHRHPLHKRRKIAIGLRPQNQMPVVAHNAVAAKTHRKPLQPFSQNLLKRRKIVRLLEYPQPAVGTVENVIYIIPFVYAFLSWHINQYKPSKPACQPKKVSDPFILCLTPLFYAGCVHLFSQPYELLKQMKNAILISN